MPKVIKFFFFSSRRRHTRSDRDWSSDVCSSDLALEAVNLLNGVDQVRLREFFTENREQVVQVERAIDEGLTGLDVVAFLNVDVHTAGDGILLGGLAILAFDVNFAHTLGDVAVTDAA